MPAAPRRLRLEHRGCSHLHVEHHTGALDFDPCSPPGRDATALLTWNEQERAQGILQALRQGEPPTVVSSERLLVWLGPHSDGSTLAPPAEIGGLRVEATPYQPVPYVDMKEGLLKVRSAMRNPWRAARRIGNRLATPSAWPLVYKITFPGGDTLVHLNCALHRWTEQAWLAEARREYHGATWLVAGVDHDQHDAFASMIAPFEPEHLILADLTGDVRRSLDLPTQPLGPLADALRRRHMSTQVLASVSSLCFWR